MSVQETKPYQPKHAVRFVTASSLFDGHDASINIMRRILQSTGVEVVHLGHNRSVDEIVTAAIQEDVQGIAVSSYQGGHVEFFQYMIDLLRERGASDIQVFGGGGGVIVPEEIAELESYGVAKIFSPDDGRRMGLQGMINHMVRACDRRAISELHDEVERLSTRDAQAVAKLITVVEQGERCQNAEPQGTDLDSQALAMAKTVTQSIESLLSQGRAVGPVIGITGTGGAGKSSLTDELVRRFLRDFDELQIAILSVDPSRARTGGALLGDRIRMNSIHHPRVYMRSLATRKSGSELSHAIRDAIQIVKAAGFDVIIVETSGIGQGDAGIVSLADASVYVMTADYGAPSQLEKIDMLDYADLIAINKFDRRGSEDALRHVRKQVQRNRAAFSTPLESMPVFGTMASQFNDVGTNQLYLALLDTLKSKSQLDFKALQGNRPTGQHGQAIIPGHRAHYLLDIVQTVRNYRQDVERQSAIARQCYQLRGAAAYLREQNARNGQISSLRTSSDGAAPSSPAKDANFVAANSVAADSLDALADTLWATLDEGCQQTLSQWEKTKMTYAADEFVTTVRDREIRTPLFTTSLSGTRIPKVALPQYHDWGDIVSWTLLENAPGEFPYTAGVFPLKRAEEAPTRMFAGEGSPLRTNRRFHFLSQNEKAKRLSTAFDSVTLYGEDPDERPDIYGKIGESGVSVCTLDDMLQLYDGFDLCSPNTSVSMTINGPAPTLLAMFLNTAIHQQIEKFTRENGRDPTPDEQARIQSWTLQTVRGTVQADILKEDQGQNTCIFSTEFALRMMGDIQAYFIENGVRNYYSVSISGYHIAEAGANPITQLAFTLANAFTYVEYYLGRGMAIDDFAPNLSFFFSNGMDPEYTVIGRVARRIWATVMKHKYGANERSQKLKYHIQTSGRSLHAQEIDFNDIRTTLQALIAIYDHCNSLHTNAYDEAITTPTEDSVRRALAIQMIINREFGLAKNENPLQGSFIIETLTDLVEEAVLAQFEQLNDRGGVLGAMETQYQRSKIQEESMLYEHLKHSGELPIIGVNTFINPKTLSPDYVPAKVQLARATPEEKNRQIENLRAFQRRHAQSCAAALQELQEVAESGGNLFAALMETVKVASLGQITQALYAVGGRYRRNM